MSLIEMLSGEARPTNQPWPSPQCQGPRASVHYDFNLRLRQRDVGKLGKQSPVGMFGAKGPLPTSRHIPLSVPLSFCTVYS